MLKFLPIILVIILSLMNIQFRDDKPFHIATSDFKEDILNEEPIHDVELNTIHTVRLTWNPVPYAVRYKISYGDKSVISPTIGVELPVNSADEVFKITALDFDRNVVAEDLPIISTEINPKAMLTTSEFDKMAYPPLYLVYSWIPIQEADHYEIRLWKDEKVIRNFVTASYSKDENIFDFYDDDPVIEDGNYFWQIRGVSAENLAITGWSAITPSNSFTVDKPARYCALGDSITHGGSVTVPPSQVFCNWETYCNWPIKNLGHSGDTTEQILDRFDEDVLPFKPEILFIMAGVNDFRLGILGSYSVRNLADIRDKCEEQGITPVFITPTPINADKIFKANFVAAPPTDWRYQQEKICDWVRQQKYFIDISAEMTDEDGNLKADLTTDGLHPHSEGKKIIGKAVEKWILDNLN